MTTDHRTDTVFFSDLLPKRCPELYSSITAALDERTVIYRLLPNTNDIWCRDYMPIQTADNRFVFYKYSPDYLNTPYYSRTITKVKAIPCIVDPLQETFYNLDLILDGGNAVKCLDKVIMTEKVFFENKNKPRNRVMHGHNFFSVFALRKSMLRMRKLSPPTRKPPIWAAMRRSASWTFGTATEKEDWRRMSQSLTDGS